MRNYVVLLITVLAISTIKAFPCSCVPGVTLAEAFATASAVFTAKIISEVESDPATNSRTYTMKVLQTWKGSFSATEIVSTQQGSSAACGVYFKTDSVYLIFAYSLSNETFSTSSCGINKPAYLLTNEIEELNELSGTTSRNNSNLDEFRIFPNPSSGTIYMKSAGSLSNIRLYDYSGRILWQQQEVENTLTLPKLKAGIYLLVLNRNGTRYSQKLHIY